MKDIKKIIRSNDAFEILDNSNCAGSDWGAGGCAILAQALNKLKGYPLYVMIGLDFLLIMRCLEVESYLLFLMMSL